jgi:hypothetical protein
LSRDELERALAAATAAPSILNCQPWHFHAHGDVIDISVLADSTPHQLDPHGREVYLSLGAAIFNLRLAILAAERMPVVQLLPDPYNRLLVARVRVAGPGALAPLELPLFHAIPRRRSSRMPFSDAPVPIEDFIQLQEAAALEGCHLEAATGAYRSAVVQASHEAERMQSSDDRLREEVRLWTLARHSDDVGIPVQSLGPRAADPSATTRDIALGQHVPDRPLAMFETAALLGVLTTTGDAPINWLRAGLSLERVLLSATARDISVGLLAQSTEFADLRLMLRDPLSPWHYPQLALRFGYGPPMPPTPRRPVADVLEVS